MPVRHRRYAAAYKVQRKLVPPKVAIANRLAVPMGGTGRRGLAAVPKSGGSRSGPAKLVPPRGFEPLFQP